MSILSSPHCHTTYVDGKSSAEEMVLSALSKGFISLGFSEHGQQEYDAEHNLSPENNIAYINTVLGLREKYRDKIRIHLGIERDRYSYAKRSDYEYVLGACHYFLDNGSYYAVDGSYESAIKYRDNYNSGDGVAMAKKYYKEVIAYASEYKYDIFAHFDLVKIQNNDNRVYNEDDKSLIDAQFDALQAVYDSGALLEVNTGGMARGYRDEPYPSQRLLKRWHELGGSIIAGSDCHFAPKIDYAFDILPDYMKAAGFKTAWRLSGIGESGLFTEYAL